VRGGALLLAAAVALAGGCNGSRDGAPASDAALVLVALDGTPPADVVTARVEVVSTPAGRERGLMFRDPLPADTGMLFAYPESREFAFWMKNCRHPLSAAFLDADGRILNVAEMAPGAGLPDSELPTYPAKGPARFAIEMESGWFARKGLKAGDRVDMSAVMKGVEPR
jgi:uncharacterized membrane protein (UPF0127 family)